MILRFEVLVLAGGAMAGSCSAPRPVEVPASAPAAVVSSVSPPDAGAPAKDWMWELLGGTRVVHLRARTADGSVRCERYRLEPAGLPADYRGTLILQAEGQPVGVEADYEGSPPRLSVPRVRLAHATLPLDCEEGNLAWYLSEEACAEGGEAHLRGAGCTSVTSLAAREGARRMLSGETRRALLSRLSTAKRLWRGPECDQEFVRAVSQSRFAEAPSLLRNGKPVYLFLETDVQEYPWLVRPGPAGGLILEESPERNPHMRGDGGEGIGHLGCCASSSYDVLDVTAEGALVRPQQGGSTRSPPLNATAWFFSKEACERGRSRN
jgi:hypothetical protein